MKNMSKFGQIMQIHKFYYVIRILIQLAMYDFTNFPVFTWFCIIFAMI